MKYKPRSIDEFSDAALMITWDDGHESIYLYEDLRRECPCATCRKLKSSGRTPFKKTIPLRVKSTNVRPTQIDSVGRYAIQFKWSDRHDTGIYSFDFLRGLCPCEQCSS